jgi:hypothetical protein
LHAPTETAWTAPATTVHTVKVELVKATEPLLDVAFKAWSGSAYFIATGALNVMTFFVANGFADFDATALEPRLFVARIWIV